MDGSTPGWAQARFGEHAAAIQGAIWRALGETAQGVADIRAASRNKKGFAPGGERAVDQFELLVDELVGLSIEGTEVVRTGSWYELPLVLNTLIYPVHTGNGDDHAERWPRRKLSKLMKEIFAATATGRRWVADALSGFEIEEGLRASLADLAGRDPRPRLVLVVYEMDGSGLKRAWWGEAELRNESGTLRWLTERSSLVAPLATPLASVPDGTGDDRFDSGELPELPMAGRPAEERQSEQPLRTEQADETDDNAVESDEN
ncbi:hypothetical protein ACFV2N_22055 [Streptomyces sp. NPDC059680]|uniref:hypothetical protein n=1 Tax=Streptomyces sp. NPDC059680 TaxID=3346904 RepID=UPI0036B53186